jgi:hypothetical protein
MDGLMGQGEDEATGSAPGVQGLPSAESAIERTLGTLASLNPVYADDVATAESVTIDDLYRNYRMGMVRLAILLVDDPASAEDVVQEAFTGLYRNWSGLRDKAAAIH